MRFTKRREHPIIITVEEIQIFSMFMKTADNKKAVVPNSKITGDRITMYPPAVK